MAKQPETKVKFSIFNKEFNDGMKEMGQESQRLNKEFKLQEAQMQETGTATEKLQAKITYLGKQQALTKRKIQETEKALAKAKQYYGENSNEANRLSNTLLDLRLNEQRLSNQLSRTESDLNQQGQAMDEAARKVKKFGKATKDIGRNAKESGVNLTKGLTLPIAGVGVGAGKMAIDIDAATRLLQGSLGATGKEADQLSADMMSVWKEGFGDNPEQISRAMGMVKQNIKGVNSGKPLQQVTKDALVLANVTESDVGEVTRGVNQLMHNFGLTSQQAFDLFAKGNQKGLNYSKEMFDNVSEYAPLFKNMGFSADEYFSILVNGSKNGAYNLDYVNDIMKEFNIRARDGSKTTSQGFSQMSQSTQDVFRKFKDGKATTQELFNAVIPELQNMNDQTKAGQIGVALFGTKFEDMGAKTVYSLDNVNTALTGTQGTMAALTDSQEEAFGTRLKGSINKVGAALKPLGEVLLNLLVQVTPYLEKFAGWFEKLSPSIQKIVVAVGLLLAIFGPLLAVVGFIVQGFGGLILLFIRVWSIISKLSIIFKILRVAFFALTGPVGLIIAIIVALVATFVILWNKSDAFRNFFINMWNNIKLILAVTLAVIKNVLITTFNSVWLAIRVIIALLKASIVGTWNGIKLATILVFNLIKNTLINIWNVIKIAVVAVITAFVNRAKAIFNGFKAAISAVFNAVKSFFSSVWNGIKNTVVNAVNGLKNKAVAVFNALKSSVSSIFNSVRSVASNVWNSIKSTISNVVSSAKNKVTSTFDSMRSRVSSIFSSIRSTASSVFNRVKSVITNPIESAKRTVLGIIGKIKSAFSGLHIRIPHIKLPHISFSTGHKKIGPISVPYPQPHISWYKTGGVFTKPTVAGNAGFGDVKEAIVPFEGSHADKIASLIAKAQQKLSVNLADRVQSMMLTLQLQPADIYMDGKKVGQSTWKEVKTQINRNGDRSRRGL